MTNPWPWPGDSPVERRARVARSYRDALEEVDSDRCAKLDAAMLRLGQRWVVPTVAVYTDDDLLTADLVADWTNVTLKAVYEWRQLWLRTDGKRGLKPSDTVDGIRFRFADVREWLGNRA